MFSNSIARNFNFCEKCKAPIPVGLRFCSKHIKNYENEYKKKIYDLKLQK